jgi:hypothetical protein
MPVISEMKVRNKTVSAGHLEMQGKSDATSFAGCPKILHLASSTVTKQKYGYNETNPMHCLSSVYSVTVPLHVSGLLVVHHQEVTMYIYMIIGMCCAC